MIKFFTFLLTILPIISFGQFGGGVGVGGSGIYKESPLLGEKIYSPKFIAEFFYTIGDRFILEPGISFSEKGIYTKLNGPGVPGDPFGFDNTGVDYYYILGKVGAGYSKSRFSGIVSPYLGYLAGVRQHLIYNNGDRYSNFTGNHSLHKLTVGLAASVRYAFNISEKLVLYISPEFQQDLTKLTRYSGRNYAWYLKVGLRGRSSD